MTLEKRRSKPNGFPSTTRASLRDNLICRGKRGEGNSHSAYASRVRRHDDLIGRNDAITTDESLEFRGRRKQKRAEQ